MPLRNAQDLFRHELSDIYQTEQVLVKELPQLANAVSDPQVKQALQLHEQQTRQHVQNLEQCFQILGMQPEKVTPYVIDGLRRSFEEISRQGPPDDVLTMATLDAAAQTEHLEMACYRGLVDKAKLMGQTECARLLEQNLRQEEEAAKKVEQLGHQFGQKLIGAMSGQMGQQPGQHPPTS